MSRDHQQGKFISLEGMEGTGKSTQARLLHSYLTKNNIKALLTVEPGGTPIGLEIREILLQPDHKEMDPLTELLLYLASRRQHVAEVIKPALEAGLTVISDRFSDSTFAYQGYARGLDLDLIKTLNNTATGGLVPDFTIILDIDPEIGLQRNRDAGKSDRLEQEAIGFHRKVREGFFEIARSEPQRFCVLNSEGKREDTHKKVVEAVRGSVFPELP